MCGRFSLYKISEFFNQYNVHSDQPLKPRYNIAPTQLSPVILDNELRILKWGFEFRTLVINTRFETWSEKPFFKGLERVLVPADGFFEWKDNVPYRIETGKVFAFAGLVHKDTFSIVTTVPVNALKQIHPRMPAVLKDEKAWLNDGTISLQDSFKAFQVNKLVNSPANDVPEVLQPINQMKN